MVFAVQFDDDEYDDVAGEVGVLVVVLVVDVVEQVEQTHLDQLEYHCLVKVLEGYQGFDFLLVLQKELLFAVFLSVSI